MADLGREPWQAVYGSATEGFDYFAACEQAPAPTFRYSAIGIFDGDRLVAGGPVFHTTFNPGLVLEGGIRSAFQLASRAIPSLASVPVIGFGSPHTQESTLAFDPGLSAAERGAALRVLNDAIENLAAETGARLVLFKDVGEDVSIWAGDILKTSGFARAVSLPVAILPVPASEDDYIRSLSANMRSNLRRRLKRAKNVRVDIRDNCEGLVEQLHAMRKGTMQRASVDYAQFAETAPNFYDSVLHGMPDNARLLTYWLDDQLIGFAMVLLGPDKLVQNYNGMRYPEGPDNGLFYLDWMTQLRLCIEHGMRELQSGVTTYLIKARLGSQFHRCHLYVRHRYGAVNAVVKSIVPSVNLEHSDPGLLELGDRAPFVEATAQGMID